MIQYFIYRVSVRLGEWNLNTDVDCYEKACAEPAQDVPIEEIITHESYADRGSRYNDIALLRLSREVEYTGENNLYISFMARKSHLSHFQPFRK